MSNRGRSRGVAYSRHGIRGGASTPPGGRQHRAPEDDFRADHSRFPSDRMAQGRGKGTQQKSVGNRPQHSRYKPTLVSDYQPKLPSRSVDDELPRQIELEKDKDASESGVISSNQSNDPCDSDSGNKDDHHAILSVQSVYMASHPSKMIDELSLTSKSGTSGLSSQQRDSCTSGIGDSGHLTFDICPPKPAALLTLKPSLLEMNKERRNEKKRFMEGKNETVLRPGMVLLENYLSLDEQVKIVKVCRELGLGPGGFYQPGYRDGAQLHLKMMCFGKFWDPQTGKYGDRRPFDDAEPPSIPDEFCNLVKRAIKDSHALIKAKSKASNVEDILPWMKPDVCIVNFYSASGRLGLHQDRDESQRSLDKGLPVVSFSIGDSGEFLYGDQRDAEKAKKVVLKSGDVLVFGGKSRHIFHGVTSIVSESAPKTLLEETNLRQGRLNLTFREY